MSNINDQHREAYLEEAFELLNELEEALLELEENHESQDLVSRVFRALHTIKGSGAMFGFDEIAGFTHNIENVYDLVRNDRMKVTTELIDITLEARDHIRILLDTTTELSLADKEEGERILGIFRDIVPVSVDTKESEAVPVQDVDITPSIEQTDRTFRILFRPHKDVFLSGQNPQFVLEDLGKLGKCYLLANLSDIPGLSEFSPEQCYISWDILLTTNRTENDIRDVFIFVEDSAEIEVTLIDEAGLITEEEDYKKIGEILVEKGTISQKDIEEFAGKSKKLGEKLVESGMVGKRDVTTALAEQEMVKDARKKRMAQDQASTIRVPTEKLDKLVDLVGEMVTTQARLTQQTYGRKDPLMTAIAEEVERLTTELHDSTMSIRMVPIGSTFSKFRRLVRDLSQDLGRDIDLVMDGAETELDKTVIDRLNDPLVHLIRNSVDHGIEPPSVRKSAGKHVMGTIKISALHSGSDVLIKVQDDGAGLDLKAVRRKAVGMGLIAADEEISEHDLVSLIFQPGFSTASKVTNVSGRGVGMDVVKRSVEALRGSVEGATRKGLGTTITLRIPLTLAVIEGLLVKIGGSYFVLSLSNVEECVELDTVAAREDHGRSLVEVRGELVPYIKLRDKFDAGGERLDLEQVVIVRHDEKRVGLAVDEVIGEHQTVIKSLSKVYRDVKSISGATILGDGTVALILDIPRVIEEAEISEEIETGKNKT